MAIGCKHFKKMGYVEKVRVLLSLLIMVFFSILIIYMVYNPISFELLSLGLVAFALFLSGTIFVYILLRTLKVGE